MALTGKIATAFVDIKGDTKKYQQSLGGVKKSLFSLKSIGIAAGIGLAAVAGVAIVRGVRAAVEAFKAEEDAIAKLNAVLKATKGAAGFSSKELVDYAQSLQDVTTFSNDVVINTQAILATFKNISGEVFKDATESILDMAIVLDQDAKQGAIALGKALNDPIRGVTALTRVGITFTDAQKEQIRVMQEAGDLTGAQTVIMDELKFQFEGAARAARNTFGGAITGLKNNLEDFGKIAIRAFGGLGVTGAINSFSEGMKKITKWTKEATSTKEWKQFVAVIKFLMKRTWLILKTPFVLFIALLKDVWEILKKYVVKPLTSLLSVLGIFSGKFAGIAETMAEMFADILPDAISHTSKAIKDLAAESRKNKEDLKKDWKEAKDGAESTAKAFVKSEKGKKDAIDETTKAREKGIFTDAVGIYKIAQQAAFANQKLKAGMGGVAAPVAANIAAPSQKINEFKTSTNKTASVLNSILGAIKKGNDYLVDIEKNTEAFSVFA